MLRALGRQSLLLPATHCWQTPEEPKQGPSRSCIRGCNSSYYRLRHDHKLNDSLGNLMRSCLKIKSKKRAEDGRVVAWHASGPGFHP